MKHRHTHHHEEARRHAENTLADVNRHLENPRIARNPKYRAMLTRMKHESVDTLDKLDHMRERADYNDFNDRVLPHLDDMDDDRYDTDNRRGVKGTGRYGRGRTRGGRVRVGGYSRRRPRMDINDDWQDDADDRYGRHEHHPHSDDDIHPSTPVMPHDRYKTHDRRDDAHDDRNPIGPGRR